MDDAALYNGKVVDLREKMADIVEGLKGCSNFEGVVSIPRYEEPRDISRVPKAETLASFLSAAPKNAPLPEFVRVPFHEPFLICYSSGTTGTPKAIVHSVGGILVNYYKEGVLHEGLSSDSVTLQYTTTGWIMYLANCSILLLGGRTVFYDGSPFQPDATILLRIAAEQQVTKLGISPRWMFELAKAGLRPRDMFDLSRLRTVTCTGMVLSEQLFEWFYDVGFPRHTHLANISGGTDIAGCFGIMNPLEPVYVGGTQGPSLGVHVAIYDSLLPDGVKGEEVPHGTPGELVAASAFPNIPCFFWGDKPPATTTSTSTSTSPAAPGTKYHSAYFARFQHVWAHGDFCVVHPVTGNITFLGRADGVLNPSGVRFGSAEIYSVVERRFADRVQDSLCVGQRRPQDADEAVMLFLLMKPGVRFERGLVNEIRTAIETDLSKRHVPKYIFETPEIPVGSRLCCFCYEVPELLTVINNADDDQPQKGRVARQADRFRADHQGKRHAS
jgi:acetoacetyl-CoA synthetase